MLFRYMYIDNSTPLTLAIDTYLDWKATYTHIASSRYKVRLTEFCNYLGADTMLSSITNANIQSFTNYMRQLILSNGQKYSDTTIAYSTVILKNFFEFWKGRGLTTINPKEIRSIRHIKNYKEHVEFDEIEKLLSTLDEHYYEDVLKKLVVRLLWDTGMRVSELIQLDLDQIKPTASGEKGSAIIRTRKTMRYNLVVWGIETNRLLNLYLGARLCKYPYQNALLISKRTGERITERTIQRWIVTLTKQGGIHKKLTPHSFRHGKAHHMLNQGANQRDIMAVLRHANPMSSFHYLSLNEKHFSQIAEKYLQ